MQTITKTLPPAATCSEHAWCAVSMGSSDHDLFHAGDVVQLTGEAGDGWHAWPVQDRGRALVINVEGDLPGETVTLTAEAEALALILSATATPEGRERLVQLLRSAGVEVAR